MKKLIVLFAAAMLLLGLSGQAMAYFSAGDLIQVVYQTNANNEVLTDLGSLSSMGGLTAAYSGPTTTLTTSSTVLPALTSSSFSGSGWNQLNIAYFVYGGTGSPQTWVSGPVTGQTSGSRKGSGYNSTAASILNWYTANSNGAAQYTGSKTGAQAYYALMDPGSLAPGTFAGFIPGANGETSLANLANAGGYVDQYLYYYSANGISQSGVKVADLRTNSDGSTRLMAPTPIPAPALLLGSGLLGLIGLRRKQSV